NLGGLVLDNIENQADVIMFFDAKPGLPNAIGSRADVLHPHLGEGCYAFADGHVLSSKEVLSQFHWVPKHTAPKPVKKAPVKK
ncbi:MAG: hypothetical protein Q7N50_14750, partial [Armatimonadota bacterium]|nr:hypothetical protein [Armatimonadota bacterium]